MRKLLLAALLLFAAPVDATVTQIIGTLTSNSGPINGQLCLSLPVNGVDTSTNRALSAQQTCFPMTNGTLPVFANVVPNDVIQPANTYYIVRAFDRAGFGRYSANWVIPTGGGTFDMGLAAPTTITTTNITYLQPGILNASQVWTAPQTMPINVVSSLPTTTFGVARTSVAGSVVLLAANSCGDIVTVTVNGATTSMYASASGSITNGLTTYAWVSSASTVSVEYCNETTGGITPAAATLQVVVIQ